MSGVYQSLNEQSRSLEVVLLLFLSLQLCSLHSDVTCNRHMRTSIRDSCEGIPAIGPRVDSGQDKSLAASIQPPIQCQSQGDISSKVFTA